MYYLLQNNDITECGQSFIFCKAKPRTSNGVNEMEFADNILKSSVLEG